MSRGVSAANRSGLSPNEELDFRMFIEGVTIDDGLIPKVTTRMYHDPQSFGGKALDVGYLRMLAADRVLGCEEGGAVRSLAEQFASLAIYEVGGMEPEERVRRSGELFIGSYLLENREFSANEYSAHLARFYRELGVIETGQALADWSIAAHLRGREAIAKIRDMDEVARGIDGYAAVCSFTRNLANAIDGGYAPGGLADQAERYVSERAPSSGLVGSAQVPIGF